MSTVTVAGEEAPREASRSRDGASRLVRWTTDDRPARSVAVSLVVIVAGAGLYGAVLGLWHGTTMAVYAAVKLPFVLLITAAITVAGQWLVGTLLGLRLRWLQVTALSFMTLAATAVVLASLAPVALLFTLSAPPPTPAARTAHNLLYLMHTASVAVSGLAGSALLWRALVRLAGQRTRARRIYVGWLLMLGLVGGEVAWALRPFVGSVYQPVRFLRADALNGNVYELILTDILPHLAGRTPDGRATERVVATPSPSQGD